MNSIMESSTITSDSSFTASFTTTERSSSTHWKQLQQQQLQQHLEEPASPSRPHHSSDNYYNASAQPQPIPRTTNIMKERSPKFVNEIIGVVGSSPGEAAAALEALQIVGNDVSLGNSTNNKKAEAAVLDAIPEAHNVTHNVNDTRYAPTGITHQSQPQPEQELLLLGGERKYDTRELHYKKAGDEESLWAGQEEESKQPSVVPIPAADDWSHSGNSWFMPGYTFRDQAPRARNTHLYHKQEPPTTTTMTPMEVLGNKSSLDFLKQKNNLPNNLNPVASFTSWVPTPYLVKPPKVNPEPARFSHREPLEEDPWVVPLPAIPPPPLEENQIYVETVLTDDETGDEYFEEEILEEETFEDEIIEDNDISTFADESFTETEYNDDQADTFKDEEAPPAPKAPQAQRPPLQPIVPSRPGLPQKSKLSWSAAEYGGWDKKSDSDSSSSQDDSSAQYDRSLSWDGFSSNSSSKSGKDKKSVRKAKRKQAAAPIPQHLSFSDGTHPSDLDTLTSTRRSSEESSGPKPVNSFDRSSSSSQPYSSSSSSSSSSLPSPPQSSSSSSDGFQDEYILDDKWYPSYRTLALLVLANLLVLTGIIVGVILLIQRNKRLEEEGEQDNFSTTPPVTEQAQTNGDNIFSNAQLIPGTR